MEPTISEKRNYTQIIITALLVVILLGMVGGYIYYGMWQANHMQPIVEAPADQTAAESRPSLTVDDKLKILSDLAKQADIGIGTRASIEEKEAILNKLSAEASTVNSASFEDKMKMLNELSATPSDIQPAVVEETSPVSITETAQ